MENHEVRRRFPLPKLQLQLFFFSTSVPLILERLESKSLVYLGFCLYTFLLHIYCHWNGTGRSKEEETTASPSGTIPQGFDVSAVPSVETASLYHLKLPKSIFVVFFFEKIFFKKRGEKKGEFINA